MTTKITNFAGLKVIKKKTFKDKRGYFREILRENEIGKKFPFMVMSYSKKNTLRGLHLQLKKTQGKYISVLKGKIFDVAVDLRKNSKTFGEYYSKIISDKNCLSIYIPPGFAHGFCCLENENYIIYSCSDYRDKKSEIGINFNDPELKIKWPVKTPIISKKDLNNLSFLEFKSKYIK